MYERDLFAIHQKYGEVSELTLASFDDNAIPRYAMLSHLGVNVEEITFMAWKKATASTNRATRRYMATRKCWSTRVFAPAESKQSNIDYSTSVNTLCIDRSDKDRKSVV